MASTLAEEADQKTSKLLEKTGSQGERPGSDRYQDDHMGKIFGEGLSFSGFERNRVFLRTADGRYDDVSDVSGADTPRDCRGTVVADFDDDGDPDVFCTTIQGDGNLLFRNDLGTATGNGFVKIRLRSVHGNSQAVGATVTVQATIAGQECVQTRLLAVGSGFESQDTAELIFGLGTAPSATVSVQWPGRQKEEFGKVTAGQRYLLVEDSATAELREGRTFAFREPGPRGVKVHVGDALGLLELVDSAGATHALKLAEDKPTLINFWATSCVSCLQELPLLDRLDGAGKYQVICVSLDPQERSERATQILGERAPKVGSFFIADTQAERLFELSRLAIPVSLFVNPDGRIERIVSGKLEEHD